ncbi:MAG TPA: neutral zinc metallopeptidase [Propionibacteriaceae bacterium]|nr:neutral zinc metallopeptidase [Propionibacteriaceae bacterium]
MTQQQWGRQPRWGQPPRRGWNQPGRQPYPLPQAYRQYPPAGFGQNPYGQVYAPNQFLPPRRRKRHPFRGLLMAALVIAAIAWVGMAMTNTVSEAPAGAYENEDYRVPPPDATPPPLPVPETYEEAEQILVSSTFYEQTAPAPVRCEAQPVNVRTARNAELRSHFEALMECLVRVWQPPVDAAGFQVVRPTVTIYGARVTTKCGDAEVNAFYCAGDQQVYFSNQLADYVPIVRRDRWAADVVMAHEFGHAVQARTAILISSHALGQQSGDQQVELELSRRLEVQADCLSGMFMRSVSQSLGIEEADLEGIRNTYEAVGDDVVSGKPNVVGNHGLARSREYWGNVGLGTDAVGRCNSFTAQDNLVR